MPTFQSHDGIEINYVDEGSGPAIVLVHGFASNLHGNWRAPGMFAALRGEGRRVVALDCRGHGRSQKPYDPDAYAGTKMADDVIALMDHLDISVADLMGYSMGGFIASGLMVRRPGRFRSVILAGVGDAIIGGMRRRSDAIAAAMEADDPRAATDETARGFRIFAERSGNDLKALAAMQRTDRRTAEGATAESLAHVTLPVMIVLGEGDTLVGSGDRLAATIPGARYVRVPGDHLTAVAAKEYRNAVVSFLRDVSPIP